MMPVLYALVALLALASPAEAARRHAKPKAHYRALPLQPVRYTVNRTVRVRVGNKIFDVLTRW